MKLFQYAIIWHPNAKQVKDGEKSKLLVEITSVLAKDERSLLMQASMQIPKDYQEQLDQVEIAIRPF